MGAPVKQWYAVKSKPRRELAAVAQLARAGLDVYLPVTARRRAEGGAALPEPYFPGYLFSRLDPLRGEIRLVRYTAGVLYVVGYGDDPWPVPDELVESIRTRLADEGRRSNGRDFKPGERLVVTSGPLKDAEAIFDRHLSGAGRARVLIRMLERLCRAELNVGQLRRAG